MTGVDPGTRVVELAGEDSNVLIHQGGGCLRIKWNRPDTLNALTVDMVHTATDTVRAATHDPKVRVIVFGGEGTAFSSGADLQTLDQDELPAPETIDCANGLISAIRDAPQPIVAAVHGPAAGVGCSIALAADFTIAAESAYFLLAFANVGLMPDGGATALVPAAIGRARATRMAMLAERVAAATALDWGLISQCVPDGQFPGELDRLVAKLADGPTAAFTQIKRALNATTLHGLPSALATERSGQLALFESRDFAEGTSAFREKRHPSFQGD